MRKILFVGILFLAILIAGCIGEEKNEADKFEKVMEVKSMENEKTEKTTDEQNQIYNCMEDMDCFIEKASECIASNVTYTYKTNLFGAVITTENYYEIKGKQDGKCLLYIKNLNQKLEYSEEAKEKMRESGLSEDEINENEEKANEAVKAQIGKYLTCKFESEEDLTNLLQKWKDGNFSGGASCKLTPEGSKCEYTGDLSVAECEGTMYQ